MTDKNDIVCVRLIIPNTKYIITYKYVNNFYIYYLTAQHLSKSVENEFLNYICFSFYLLLGNKVWRNS